MATLGAKVLGGALLRVQWSPERRWLAELTDKCCRHCGAQFLRALGFGCRAEAPASGPVNRPRGMELAIWPSGRVAAVAVAFEKPAGLHAGTEARLLAAVGAKAARGEHHAVIMSKC